MIEEKKEDLKKKMNIANRTMIEKEKFYEVISSMKKTSESKILTKKLQKAKIQ
jgi:hypothetical protein